MVSLVSLTDSARQQMIDLCKQHDTDAVHLSVKGGGCSGFKYEWGFVKADEINAGDEVIDLGDAKFVVDGVSIMYVAGTEVDFVRETFGSHFNIKNPTATASCGCGESFAV
tara:strand:+ start:779 stop:1111 length:333 start_codon:yes stop_codon:yes gene_type:complete